jgi:D-glucosaminate-6-phosphate ammonia-lyase
MPTIYDRLGVRPIINAGGPNTRLSGGIMAEPVVQAMAEASQHCVDMFELQARASAIIAEITGAEAGLVTSGASAALLVGLAACVTGLDPARMNRLPDTTGMRDQVIVVRSQRNFYDRAIRSLGVELVEVGISDRFSDAGVRDTEAWEIAAAITDRTAAVYYLAKPHSLPPLAEVVAAAHGRGVPVVVDAAAQLPPRDNLRRFLREGADLVAFSGGKAIGGPQASGILAGRKDLVTAATLQQLDMDVFFELWEPPPGFVDKAALPGLPHHGIGRPCKAGKEEIVGLLTALRLFSEEDGRRAARWRQLAEALLAALKDLPGAAVGLASDRRATGIPLVEIRLAAPDDGFAVVRRLEQGEPSVRVNVSRAREGVLLLSPVCLREDQVAALAKKLRAAMS